MTDGAETMEEIGETIGAIWALLDRHDWAKIDAGLQRLDTLAPIIDPTAYRGALHDGTLQRNQRLVAATRRYHDELQALRAEVDPSPTG